MRDNTAKIAVSSSHELGSVREPVDSHKSARHKRGTAGEADNALSPNVPSPNIPLVGRGRITRLACCGLSTQSCDGRSWWVDGEMMIAGCNRRNYSFV